MAGIRLIARLDIKGHNLIKGMHLEGLRVLGDPQEFAKRYYEAGIDELIYMDVVASLYGRNNLAEVVSWTAHHAFVPLTVGGGIRSLDDAMLVMRAGADKVAINTAATKRPELLMELAQRFGSQAVVLSIEAKRIDEGKWEVYTDNGRERTGMDVLQWAERAESLGAGEILLTSVDQEGTRRGFDVDLVQMVATRVSIPVIASGGMGSAEHLVDVVKRGSADAVAMADILHYERLGLTEIHAIAKAAGIETRQP